MKASQLQQSDDKRYRIKIYNKSGLLEEDTKDFVAQYTRWKKKDVPGLGERLRDDQLLESDIFILKEWLVDFFVMHNKTVKYELV